MKNKMVTTAVISALLLFANSAFAAMSTKSSFSVNATVVGSCNIMSNPINFPGYVAGGADVDATGTLSVNCPSGQAYNVDLDNGTNGGTSDRIMKDGAGNILHYQLYSDNGHAATWGSGLPGGSQVPGAGTGADQALTIFGRNRNGQSVPTGNYSDTVNAIINW